MNISWLSLNASWSHSSLALPMLERCCRQYQDWQWLVVHSTIHESPERIVEQLLKQKPDVLMATAYLFTIEPLVAVLSRIKKLRPELIILLGGPEFLGSNREFLEHHPFVDAVVRGEGEGVICHLLELIESGGSNRKAWSELAGVCVRLPGGVIHDDGSHAPEQSMDVLIDPMESPIFDWSKTFIQLETSRGCHAVCTFCTSAISSGGRILSVDVVRSRLLKIREAGIRHVRLLDRSFNYPKDRAVALMRMFLEEFSDLHFHLEIYPNLVTDEMLELIEHAKPDQLHLEVGIQSTDASVLGSVKRAGFGERSEFVLKRLCEVEQVPVHVDLIVGLPSQTVENVLEDLRLLHEYLPEEIQIEVLKILKGTPIEQMLERYGISHSDTPPYEVLQTNAFPFEAIRRSMRLSRLVDHFYNHCELRDVVCTYWKSNPDFWVELEAFLSGKLDIENPLNLSVRYRWLFQFFEEHDRGIGEQLALSWIRKGHSPTKGLVEASVWKGDFPLEVVPVFENSDHQASAKEVRDSKIFHVPFASRDYWIKLYRRNQKEVVILGEWQRPNTPLKSENCD